MRTEAIIFAGINQVEVRSLAMPDPKPGEVQIRTRYPTISGGTDLRPQGLIKLQLRNQLCIRTRRVRPQITTRFRRKVCRLVKL